MTVRDSDVLMSSLNLFPDDNLFRLYCNQTSHMYLSTFRETPIDFEVKKPKVKITGQGI